jgi:hypothetical protein
LMNRNQRLFVLLPNDVIKAFDSIHRIFPTIFDRPIAVDADMGRDMKER